MPCEHKITGHNVSESGFDKRPPPAQSSIPDGAPFLTIGDEFSTSGCGTPRLTMKLEISLIHYTRGNSCDEFGPVRNRLEPRKSRLGPRNSCRKQNYAPPRISNYACRFCKQVLAPIQGLAENSQVCAPRSSAVANRLPPIRCVGNASVLHSKYDVDRTGRVINKTGHRLDGTWTHSNTDAVTAREGGARWERSTELSEPRGSR